EGMLFTRFNATGTCTVRGLEALTLSTPPIPGHSIVKRPDNDRLFSLGEVSRQKGYEPLYLYVGYAYFDNMEAFFAGNGYTVIDRARARPWFDRTLFVIVADHTLKGRGRTELPPENYHIPLIVYAPGHVPPRRIDTIASQIDVGPTILGMLDFSYRSRFFGHDILREGADHPRALLANYQTVGYYRDGVVVELKPKRRYRIVDAATGRERAED